MIEKTFQVQFEEPKGISQSKWLQQYFKPAVIMLVDYRKKNNAIALTSFYFFRQIRNKKRYWIVSQRVKLDRVMVKKMERKL